MEIFAEGVTGGIGGLVGRSIAFPFDTLKVKLATSDGVGVKAVVQRILREEGIVGFYRGIPFSAFEALYQKFIYIFFFSGLKAAVLRLTGAEASTAATVACGYLSELGSVPFAVPIEATVVRLQSAPAGTPLLPIVKENLLTRKGFMAALATGKVYIALSLKPGLEFAIFERLKKMILLSKAGPSRSPGMKLGDLTPGAAFMIGALARAVATCIIWPVARGKALLQAKLADSASEAVLKLYKTEGVLSVYRGLSMELTRGVTQAAIMFAVMERLRSSIYDAILKR